MKEYLIIGAGIVGCSLARELLRNRRGKVIILEKERAVGAHASGRNSGVIHSGINQKPGSMKAAMCVEGSRLLREYCRSRRIPFEERGTVVTAFTREERDVLDRLKSMGDACGVPGLRFLSESERLEREPCSQGGKALFSPTGATVDSLKLLETLAGEAVSLRAELLFEQRVERIRDGRVETADRVFRPDHIVNCAGLYADKIARRMGRGRSLVVFPFRGEYMQVRGVDVRSMIYRAPDLRFPFLSVHLTREPDGTVLGGPTAVLSFGRESYEKQVHVKESLDILLRLRFYLLAAQPGFFKMASQAFKMSFSAAAFRREIEQLIGPVDPGGIVPFRSGIRAQMVDARGRFVMDHRVEISREATHVLNCVSPGMTTSLAFARYLDRSMHG